MPPGRCLSIFRADAMRWPKNACLPLVMLMFIAFPLLPGVAAASGTNVLVLFSNGRLLPANLEVERGLRSALSPEQQAGLFEEFLDAHRFNGPDVERTAADYLRVKYRLRPPAVLLAVGPESLAFILASRDALFPGVPVVHLAVGGAVLQTMGPLPADVVGVPIEYDFAGSIDQGLRWHPAARHVVVVTGASPYDRAVESRLRNEVSRFQQRATFEFLAGVPDAELARRLGSLQRDTIVFTPGYFLSGSGADVTPREAARQVALLSPVPVYGPYDTFIGTGVVGGRAPSFADAGLIAGRVVNRLLAGEDPASMRLPAAQPTALHVDWRQVIRWDIDPVHAPADMIAHYRQPGFLEQYAMESILVLAVFLLQGALIAGLVAERRRRCRAELSIQKQWFELAHATRVQTGAQLAGSIAHEINQPLGAILTNAEAAEMILEAGGTERTAEVREIVGDIRRAVLRASEVIRRLRALLTRREVEQQAFAVEELVHDVEVILRPEAQSRNVRLEIQMPAGATVVAGDRIQMQQVLINLLLNAMDATAGVPDIRKQVAVTMVRHPGSVVITVRDHGHGVAAHHREKLFESFFSTKHDGMGLGLSISRRLVEAHGGRIWAEAADEGAIFNVELPTCADGAMTAAAHPVMAGAAP
jgi:signal transduction histidine kinase